MKFCSKFIQCALLKLSITIPKVTPFTLASKKETSQCTHRLTHFINTVEQQLTAWSDDGDGESTLESLGFSRSWLSNLIASAAASKDDSATRQGQQELGQIKLLVDACHKVLKNIPDPKDSEEPYLKFMAKHGAFLANKKAELEKAIQDFNTLANKYKLVVKDIDQNGDHEEGCELKSVIMVANTLYTLPMY